MIELGEEYGKDGKKKDSSGKRKSSTKQKVGWKEVTDEYTGKKKIVWDVNAEKMDFTRHVAHVEMRNGQEVEVSDSDQSDESDVSADMSEKVTTRNMSSMDMDGSLTGGSIFPLCYSDRERVEYLSMNFKKFLAANVLSVDRYSNTLTIKFTGGGDMNEKHFVEIEHVRVPLRAGEMAMIAVFETHHLENSPTGRRSVNRHSPGAGGRKSLMVNDHHKHLVTGSSRTSTFNRISFNKHTLNNAGPNSPHPGSPTNNHNHNNINSLQTVTWVGPVPVKSCIRKGGLAFLYTIDLETPDGGHTSVVKGSDEIRRFYQTGDIVMVKMLNGKWGRCKVVRIPTNEQNHHDVNDHIDHHKRDLKPVPDPDMPEWGPSAIPISQQESPHQQNQGGNRRGSQLVPNPVHSSGVTGGTTHGHRGSVVSNFGTSVSPHIINQQVGGDDLCDADSKLTLDRELIAAIPTMGLLGPPRGLWLKELDGPSSEERGMSEIHDADEESEHEKNRLTHYDFRKEFEYRPGIGMVILPYEIASSVDSSHHHHHHHHHGVENLSRDVSRTNSTTGAGLVELHSHHRKNSQRMHSGINGTEKLNSNDLHSLNNTTSKTRVSLTEGKFGRTKRSSLNSDPLSEQEVEDVMSKIKLHNQTVSPSKPGGNKFASSITNPVVSNKLSKIQEFMGDDNFETVENSQAPMTKTRTGSPPTSGPGGAGENPNYDYYSGPDVKLNKTPDGVQPSSLQLPGPPMPTRAAVIKHEKPAPPKPKPKHAHHIHHHQKKFGTPNREAALNRGATREIEQGKGLSLQEWPAEQQM